MLDPTMKSRVKAFVDQVFSINPVVSTTYGSALNAGSRAMSGGGITNSASDTVFKLRKETAIFAELINSYNPNNLEIKNSAKSIEASLMTLRTLGQISDTFCTELIDDLLAITQELS